MRLLFSAIFTASIFAFLATSALADRDDATTIAQNLRMDLVQLSGSARNVANQAEGNGNLTRADRFRDLAREATELAQDVRQYVIRPLQQGATQAQVRRGLSYVSINGVNQAASRIAQMPANVRQDLQASRLGLRQLEANLNVSWGGGGGGLGNWRAECRVVLETVWGTDLNEFYGRARGINQNAAVSAAREQGMRQCANAREGLLTRCVVDGNNCGAYRIN